MESEVEIREHAAWIYVRGRLDTETAPALDAQLADLIRDGHKNLVFELAQLEYVSSAGLSCFIAAAQRLEPQGGSVVFVSLQDFVKRIFEISALNKVYRICASADEV
jgi:anti-anti-sigma factor